jgi:hypothetical protein
MSLVTEGVLAYISPPPGVVHNVVDMVQAVGHYLVDGIALVGVGNIVDVRIGVDIVMRVARKIRALLIGRVAQVDI